MNDSNKGSNGPAGSRSGKLHSEERGGLSVTGRSPANPESSEGPPWQIIESKFCPPIVEFLIEKKICTTVFLHLYYPSFSHVGATIPKGAFSDRKGRGRREKRCNGGVSNLS